MEMNEFAKKVCGAMKRELGETCRVEVREVRKNNGVVLHGLLILPQEQNVTPTIYLEPFLESYVEGMTFAEVIRRLMGVYRKDVPKERIDMAFFRSFRQVKDRVCYRLIGRKGNEELLEQVPYIEFLDLAVCFYYAYQGEKLGEGSILIYNSHVEMWETSTAELLGLANANTPRLLPWVCSSMEEVIAGMPERNEGSEKTEQQNIFLESPMRILSNVKKMHGAVCMIYPEVLEQLSAAAQRSFYILPSSIHEVILLPDTCQGLDEELKRMIIEVNRTQVAPEEVLSDSLYYYDFSEKRVKIIF